MRVEGAQVRLANRLRVARAEKRLSQEDLAKMAGVTRQTIGAIENGQYCPSALLAFVLAERLEKPVDELFYVDTQEAS
jgi:putative transcriptional regulator